ncbi:purine and uridine phosphorylase [Aspergillus fijiensis CBS 313.89]|uniref:Purine and uridine phosphorylase n=1 Tax=Aspergillus fijiensis CBS 313.89 TaxID=1448319 RepID=A0A8G1RPP5_9EURO|nr:purine and uridine phosphorylase [Aspergillus fijiensis CBS 313.89]RAK75251.1 purine and uridine phosphorylase [Aspergillus fijiensis CBS 313.89]
MELVSTYGETDFAALQARSRVSSLLETFVLFREIADCLTSCEQDRNLRQSYRYLHVQILLLNEQVETSHFPSKSIALAPLAWLLLKRFTSLLRPPVKNSLQSPAEALQRLADVQAGWGRLTSWSEKIAYSRTNFAWETKQLWDEVAFFLEECADALDAPGPDAVGESRPPIARVNVSIPTSVHVEANLVFDALLASAQACHCLPCHTYTARLRLATYRSRRPLEQKCVFSLMLSPNESYWQEVVIQAAIPEKTSKVRIAVKESTPRKRRGETSILINKLCDHVSPQHFRRCLNMEVENGKLRKFKSADSQMQLKTIPVRLERILEAHPKSLGDRIKRVLAVLLGHCVLHLYGTPWLRPGSFNSSNIIFLGTSASVPLQPFIHSRVWARFHGDDQSDDEECRDPDDLPLHPRPGLVMLAILLIEIYQATSIRSLVRSYGAGWESLELLDENSRFHIAREAFRKCSPSFSDNYRIAVARCLDVQFGIDDKDNELEDHDFKGLIYMEIVQRLEAELRQGFSDMSLDHLDDIAPKMDLNSLETIRLPDSNEFEVDLLQPAVVTAGSRSSAPARELSIPGSMPPQLNQFDTRVSHYSSPEPVQRSRSVPIPRTQSPKRFACGDYTVGWISALDKEMATAQAMLDEEHGLPHDYRFDNNTYTLGCIGTHNVVLTCLPDGIMGTTAAAIIAQRMCQTFPHIRIGLMVGIGGAAPSVTHDIRLGDVIVGTPHHGQSGVIQYDFGKRTEAGRIHIVSALNRPPDALLTAVNSLKSKHLLYGPGLTRYLDAMVHRYPLLQAEFAYPGAGHDHLYQSDYGHRSPAGSCSTCDPARIVSRAPRATTAPMVHYGLIASGNQVMKHGPTRDRMQAELGILCFEMEAAGLVDSFPCLVIRGVSDYADSHKNDRWQGYAAAVASAYAKELLVSMSGISHSRDGTGWTDP